MALFSTKYPNTSRVVTGAAILFQNDSILLCDTSTAPVTMTLLEIPSNNWQTTWRLYVSDNSNNAATNNITISAPSGYTINNASTLVINTNGGGVAITIASNTAFFGQVSPLPSGGGGSPLDVADALGTITSNTTKITFTNAVVIPTSPTEASVTTIGGGVTSVTGTAPVSVTSGTTPVVSMAAANGSTNGYLTSANWTTFNNKSEIVAASNTAGVVVAACTNFRFKTTDFVTTNPSGNIALISKKEFPSLLAQQVPNGVILTPVALATTIFTAGQIQIIAEILDDGNDYDPTTGIWTCPESGYYNLNCYAHFSNPTGWTSGMFQAGIMTADLGNQYGGGYCTITQTIKHLDITVSVLNKDIVAGTQLVVALLNQTNAAYTAQTGDVIRFAITTQSIIPPP